MSLIRDQNANGKSFLERLRNASADASKKMKRKKSYAITNRAEKEKASAIVVSVARELEKEGHSDHLKKALALVSKDLSITRCNLKRWVEAFASQNENPEDSWGNRDRLGRKGPKRSRSHVKIPVHPKHNMEKTVRAHRELLEDTALKLVELQIPFNFTNVCDEFTQVHRNVYFCFFRILGSPPPPSFFFPPSRAGAGGSTVYLIIYKTYIRNWRLVELTG